MSVVDLAAENTITSLVDQFRPLMNYVKGNVYEKIDEGIRIRLMMRVDDYSDINAYFTEHQELIFIFTGNTSVFVSSNSNNVEDFKNTSNHDSCWRSDGLNAISQTYFDMADRINDQRKAAGMGTIAPVEMTQYNSFGFGDIVKRVRITTIPVEINSYHRKITNIENLKLEFKY